jgi:hypothetical protein
VPSSHCNSSDGVVGPDHRPGSAVATVQDAAHYVAHEHSSFDMRSFFSLLPFDTTVQKGWRDEEERDWTYVFGSGALNRSVAAAQRPSPKVL